MLDSDDEKRGVDLHAGLCGDLASSIPIKKRPLILAQSLSPTPQTSSLQDSDCGAPQKDRHCMERKPAVSESNGLPASGTYLTVRASSSESIRDTNLVPKQEVLSGLSHNEEGLNRVASSDKGTCYVEEHVAGSTLQLSTPKELLKLPLSEGSGGGMSLPSDKSAFHRVLGNTEFEMTPKGPFTLSKDGQTSERSLVKLEKLDICGNHASAERRQCFQSRCNSAEAIIDTAFPYANRSNWDLNTTMDTWEGTLNDSNHETGGYEAGVVSTFSRESNGADETLGNCQNIDAEIQISSNSSLPISELHDSAACLNSQCKSVINSESCATFGAACPSVRFSSVTEMPLPSLLVKPMPPTGDPKLGTCRDVKSEPCDESSHLDIRKVETNNVKSVGYKDIKTGLCEYLQATMESAGYGDLKSACKVAVRSEPLGDQAQQNLRRWNEKSFEIGLNYNFLTPGCLEMPQYESEYANKASSLISESLVLNSNHDGPKLPMRCIPSNRRENILGAIEGSAQTLVPHSYMPCSDGEIPVGTGLPQNASGIVSKSSDMVSESQVSESKELKSAKEALETAEGKPRVAVEVLAQMGCSDGVSHHSPKVTVADELHINLHGNSKVAEGHEVKLDASTEIKEESHDDKYKSDSSYHDIGAMDIVCKQSGKIDEYEDGEVRDMALHCAIESSLEERKEQQVNAASNADPSHHLDVSIVMPSSLDVQENKIENLDKLNNDQGTEEGDGGLYNDRNDHGIDRTRNAHESAAVGDLISGSAGKKLSKTISNNCQDRSKRNKDPETKSPHSGSLGAGTIKEGSQGEIVRQLEENSTGSDLLQAKASVLSKTESDKNGPTIKQVGSNHGRIVDLRSPQYGSASGKTKSLADKPLSSLPEREDSIGKVLRQDKSHSQGSRDENYNDRSRKFESEKHYERLVGKRESDFKHIRSRYHNQTNSSHDDWNSEPGHVSEQVNSSSGYRFPRPNYASEVASSGSIGSAGRMARKPVNDEFRAFSHVPYKRRPPGERGQIPVGIQMPHSLRPIRDISPSRCIGRDVPHFGLLAREEKGRRNLSDDMLKPPLPLHSRSQYERAEGTVNHRERSLSPVQQRGRQHIPPMFSEVSPLPDMRSLHRWPPPRRSSHLLDGHPELVRSRSPPVDRLGRMRSPYQHACFMEDMMVRRRGSPPPHVARLPDDMVDIGPPREHDFRRSVRRPSRNIGRCELIDPSEIADEELCSPLLHRQFHEPAGDDDYSADRRKYEERHGAVHSMRQYFTGHDDNGMNFDFHDENDPREFRYFPEANEEVSKRGSSGRSCRHIRNRLGNAFSRLRGIEEPEDNYRYCEELRQRHDASYNNGRPKRRRF